MITYRYGIRGQKAPEWNVDEWFNLPEATDKLSLQDFNGKVIYLYCFQSWCPGCHMHGFPTLRAVIEKFKGNTSVAFVAIQTVFEGFESNTLERAKEVALQYGLEIPVGHDPGSENSIPNIMRDYRTGGTPWTILIDTEGIVRFNDYHADAVHLCQQIEDMLAKP